MVVRGESPGSLPYVSWISGNRQPGREPRLDTADQIGGVPQAERAQAGRGEAGAVALPADHHDVPVVRDGVRLNFDVAPDGRRVVMFPKPPEAKPEGTLHAYFLLNFFDEVRRRIP